MARSPESADLPRQVEVVRGDLTVATTLDRCLDGVDAVFLMWQAPAAGVAPALERIAKQARRVVFLSNLTVRDGIEEQAYPVTTLHAKIERMIEVSGFAGPSCGPVRSLQMPGCGGRHRSVQAISCAGPTLVLSRRRSMNVISQRSRSAPCPRTDMPERNASSPALSH